MSEPCTCPIAGYCERHAVEKSEHWHYLCQTRENYRRAWDEDRGPGQRDMDAAAELTPAQLATQERIAQRVAKRDRLLSWLQFLRHPSDRGAGDTAARLYSQATEKSEAQTILSGFLRCASCKRVDAVSRLNENHPY